MCSNCFSSRRRHTRFDCDWSSDVCSSDLTITIDGKPECRSYTMVLPLVKEYGLHHRKTLDAVKASGKYQAVHEEKFFVIMKTELVKCKRRVQSKKTKYE